MTTPAGQGPDTLEESPGPGNAAASAEAPTQLGRYKVTEQIGSGGMGVVYAAYDPELERELAVKFMRPERQGSRYHSRLLREAKAMAKLSHPNLVAVHDVGTHDGRVFVVMDLVEGGTLTRWLRERPRTWREIVAMFAQAGEGLAAAHDLGFVHRDFKSENVLVGTDGRPRVVDFGLVRAVDDPVIPEDTTPAEITAELETPAPLTRTGMVMGTPGYMAPEQVFENRADAKSDQFAFCVALWEGLFGKRPFPGRTAAEIGGNVYARRMRPPRPGTDVPRWVRKILYRGLAANPKQRWANMHALLRQLRRRPLRPVAMVGAVAGIFAILAGMTITARLDEARAWIHPVELPLLSVDAAIDGPFELGDDPAIGPYAFSSVANQGRLTFTVEVPMPGSYYLWGLAWEHKLGGDRGDADSYFVYVDGGREHLWHFGCQNERSPNYVLDDHWSWQPVREMPNADSDCVIEPDLRFDLDVGIHTIVLRNREQANDAAPPARLARLVLTNDSSWTPPVEKR